MTTAAQTAQILFSYLIDRITKVTTDGSATVTNIDMACAARNLSVIEEILRWEGEMQMETRKN